MDDLFDQLLENPSGDLFWPSFDLLLARRDPKNPVWRWAKANRPGLMRRLNELAADLYMAYRLGEKPRKLRVMEREVREIARTINEEYRKAGDERV